LPFKIIIQVEPEVHMNAKTPVLEMPEAHVVETPVMEKPATEEAAGASTQTTAERTWSEEFEVAGTELVDAVKGILAEGNVRRLILRTPDGRVVLEIPLVAGAVVGGVLTFFAPLLAVLAAIATVLAHLHVEIVRVKEPTPKE
jgi:hypothetical protein